MQVPTSVGGGWREVSSSPAVPIRDKPAGAWIRLLVAELTIATSRSHSLHAFRARWIAPMIHSERLPNAPPPSRVRYVVQLPARFTFWIPARRGASLGGVTSLERVTSVPSWIPTCRRPRRRSVSAVLICRLGTLSLSGAYRSFRFSLSAFYLSSLIHVSALTFSRFRRI